MARLVLDRETSNRVRRPARRVKVLGLSKIWMAEQISRSRQNVTEVLNRTKTSRFRCDVLEKATR